MDDSGRNRRTRVLVLFGGKSGEHDVSLRSAQTVMRSLDPDRFEVVPVGITREGKWLTGGDPMLALTAESPLFALPTASPAALANGVSADIGLGGSALPAGI